MMTEKKMGRPQKISAEELEAIVRGYYITCAGEDSAALAAHNVYALLERYAADNGFRGRGGQPLRASDFRRPEIKQLIQTLAGTASARDVSLSVTPVFSKLDMQHFFSQCTEKQKDILDEREEYFKQLFIRSALAIKQYTELSASVSQAQAEISRLEVENQNLHKEIKQLSDECVGLRKENADYRRYIRKHIDPERAANFLKSMQQNGLQSATLLALAEQDVNDVIKADVTDKKRHLDVINDFFK